MNLRNFVFEFGDLAWFPDTIHQSMTDYLRYVLTALDAYQPVAPLISEGLKQTSCTQIVDLCSGGGGCIEQIKKTLDEQGDHDIKIILTDKNPNTNAYQFLYEKSNGSISFSDASVDAADVPADLEGFRTIFSAFHHFDSTTAASVIKNAVVAKSGIGIFDGGDKNIWIVIAMTIFHPIAFFFLTPFFKPFRLSRIVFTYLIPIIPFCTMWDGIVSIIRLYKPSELLAIAKQSGAENYYWKAGKMKNNLGLSVGYLVGYPMPTKHEEA